MSIDMLSQILPPKRDLPFAVVPAKRLRPDADSSSTVGESTSSLKVVLEMKKDSVKAAPKQAPTQRARPKRIAARTTRRTAPLAQKSASKEVATQEADLKEVTPEQVLPRDVTSKRALPEPPIPNCAVITAAKSVQHVSARFTRSSSKARASQKTFSQSANPPFQDHGIVSPDGAKFAVPRSAPKDAISQTTVVDIPHLLMPVSGDANAAPRPELSQEWVDRVDKHIREAGCRSGPDHVSNSALVLANRSLATCGLQVYANTPWEERKAGLTDAILTSIMDENFVALCEDVEKVLEGMRKGG
ncbi:hypothetical protein MMC26_001661 [Xylographa opegraphella]|nr:hypothetical protein [Xylographa opegraphella]